MHAAANDWDDAMRAGDHARAWRINDAVLAARDPATRDDPGVPYHLRWVWDGTPVEGRHVLVRCYHGLGDTLQYARYLPALRARAASVRVEAQPALLGLVGRLAETVAFDPARPLPPSECDVEIMELSHALRLGPALPARPTFCTPPLEGGDGGGVQHRARPSTAALHPSPRPSPSRGEGEESPVHDGCAAGVKQAAAPVPRNTAALCWRSGNWDPARSLPLAALRAALPGWRLVSLQRGPAAAEATHGFDNPGDDDPDILRTAALMQAADLVVTVDSMVAHLAGTLGLPAIVLLRHDACWRWERGPRTSWYPSLRLLRQRAPGDWSAPLAALSRAAG